MARLSIKTTIVSLLLFVTLSGLAQTYQFRNFNINEGLPGRFVYTVNQDRDGFLWLSTGKGLCRYDGFDFHYVYTADSAENEYAVSACEIDDGRIFFGFNNGSVHYTEGDHLKELKGIEASKINYLLQGPDQLVYILSQSKGMYATDPVNPDDVRKVAIPTDQFLYSAEFTSDGKLLLGTQMGLILCSIDGAEPALLANSDELEYLKIQDIISLDKQDEFLIASEDNGVYHARVSNDSIIITRISEEELFTYSRVQSLMLDESGAVWISTFGEGVLKVILNDNNKASSYQKFNEESGLASNDARITYQDIAGNIWIGLFGDGLSILGSDAYKFFGSADFGENNNIIFAGEKDGYAFAGTATGFYLFDVIKEKLISYTDISRDINMARISDYYLYEDGSMLIGTEGNGLYRRSSRGRMERVFSSGNNAENFTQDIQDDGTFIWMGTRSGVILISHESGKQIRYTTVENLPHNRINQLVLNSDGSALIASESDRLYTLDPDEGVKPGRAIIESGVRNVFNSFDRDNRRKVWGATEGSGLYCFENDSVWNLDSSVGLLSNYCYSVLADQRNNIWVGHETGFSIYMQSNGIVKTFTDIFRSGADCNDNAITEMANGYVLIGTTEGLLVFNPDRDNTKFIPPATNILSVSIDGVRMPLQKSYNLPYSSRYSIRINYVGLNYSNPDNVYYSYSLENYDTEWSDPTLQRSVEYKLSSGHYRFNVLSYSYDGSSDNNVRSFEITVKRPFWRMWWFIVSCIVIAVGSVVIIIKIRERAQAKVNQYLESELNERTREVVSQKEEIEYQNREITDSINYAQRIQASLLPRTEKLSESFDGSFVFFRPRDIVSGDFYWFNEQEDGKVIVVCADSTGHGVPGAFMSMIGSALLQEIVNRKEITRPSEILSTLDREISSTLNQGDDDTSSDGMDMVVCEYEPKTRMLRFASAMRPVILIMDGEQYYIRGNKNSVGGEGHAEKYYDDQEYYLKKGDIIYMFSDGYPDQFGGPDGKKLKIVRLKRLFDDIKDKPMDEQYNIVSEFFYKWKGELEQVDDVLLMGIQV